MKVTNIELFEEYISEELFRKIGHYNLGELKTAAALHRSGILSNAEYEEIYQASRKISEYRLQTKNVK